MTKQTEELIAIAIIAFVAWHYLSTSAATTQAELAASTASAGTSSGFSDVTSALTSVGAFASDFS